MGKVVIRDDVHRRCKAVAAYYSTRVGDLITAVLEAHLEEWISQHTPGVSVGSDARASPHKDPLDEFFVDHNI